MRWYKYYSDDDCLLKALNKLTRFIQPECIKIKGKEIYYYSSEQILFQVRGKHKTMEDITESTKKGIKEAIDKANRERIR